MDPSNPTGQGGNDAGPAGPDAAGMPVNPAQDAAAMPPMTLPLPPQPEGMPRIGQTPPPKRDRSDNQAQAGVQDASQAPQNDVDGTTQAVNVPVLDDGDLIEKEWVNKAKQIVEKNRNDPHKQSEQLTAFRADYMKKHYNKDIKLDE